MPPHTHSGSSVDPQPTLRGRNEEKQPADRSPLPNVPSDKHHTIKHYLGQGRADPTGLFLQSNAMKVIQQLDSGYSGPHVTPNYPQFVVLEDEPQDADGESSHRCQGPDLSPTNSSTPRKCVDCDNIIPEGQGVPATDAEPSSAESSPSQKGKKRAPTNAKSDGNPKGATNNP